MGRDALESGRDLPLLSFISREGGGPLHSSLPFVFLDFSDSLLHPKVQWEFSMLGKSSLFVLAVGLSLFTFVLLFYCF